MLPHWQTGIEESGQYTSELVSCRAERSEVSRTALQVFPFSTGFRSLFPISHSLVFHLISSQFPSSTLSHIHLDSCNLPFSPSTIWWLTETRLFRSEKCLQVKSSCWQPLPANPIYLDGAWALHLGRPRVWQTHTFGIWCSVLHNSITSHSKLLLLWAAMFRLQRRLLLHIPCSVSWKPKVASFWDGRVSSGLWGGQCQRTLLGRVGRIGQQKHLGKKKTN